MIAHDPVVDADSHVLEPADLWLNYIDPKYRELAPRVTVDKDGRDVFQVPGGVGTVRGSTQFEKGVGHLGAFGAAWGLCPLEQPYASCRAGYDPGARLAYMDGEGIDVAALYPSLGLVLGGLSDPEHAAACYRAYNRWLAEFCAASPDRLIGVAMLPLQSVELAIQELRYARSTLGLRAIFVRPNPYAGRQLGDGAYAPLWQEAQELDCAVAIHTGSAGDMPTIGMDRIGQHFMTRHIVAHAFENMLAMVNMVFGGICERFPRLRVGFFEGGGGWLPGWLDRLDRHHEKVFSDDILTSKPSAIFKRQCWIAFDPTERSLPHAVDYLGADNILFATDYPHPDGVPAAVGLIRDNERLAAESRRKILGENALAFYGSAPARRGGAR